MSYYAKNNINRQNEIMVDCIFCKIASGEIPSKKIFEDESVLAFYDTSPKAPTHFLVIPKKHIATLDDCTQNEQELLGTMVLTAKKIAMDGGLSPSGYRMVMNAHEVGGRQMTWPPG
jgi:histidine triad (HIT) family protein